jgi:hypothetical protein
VDLKLDHILAGKRMRAWEPQHQTAVDQRIGCIAQLRVMRMPRLQFERAQGLRNLPGLGAGQTHDTDAARTRSRGNRRDGGARRHRITPPSFRPPRCAA